MHDQCEGPQLLQIARETLKSTLKNSGADANKLPILMAINAIGIVERENTSSQKLISTEINLFTGSGASSIGEICSRIRSGQFDENATLFQALLQSAQVRAHIYKPSVC